MTRRLIDLLGTFPRGSSRRSSPRSVIVARGMLMGVAAMAISAGGCFSTDNGPPPPQSQLYFPTGLVVSPGGHALYVVNSDFDLQFDAGTVLALDLDRIRTMAQQLRDNFPNHGCTLSTAAADPSYYLLYPAPCTSIDVLAPGDNKGSLIASAVDIGAFAADVALIQEKKDGTGAARLVVPVRGDPSLTWIGIDNDFGAKSSKFTLDCDPDSSGRCGDSHRAGIDMDENTRQETMPSEPFAVAASYDTSAIVTTHQTSGTASLFLNSWNEDRTPDPTSACPGGQKPGSLLKPIVLSYVSGGLPTGVTGIAAFPTPALNDFYAANSIDYSFQPGFLVSYRNSAELDVLRYYDDCQAAPSRPYLVRTAQYGTYTNSSGYDSRSIAIDTTARTTAEKACLTKMPDAQTDCAAGLAMQASMNETVDYTAIKACTDFETCLQSAASTPIDVFVANRLPPSLLVGQTTANASRYGTSDGIVLSDPIPLSTGASRVQIGSIIGHDGQPESRVFIVCFDSRLLYVYDPKTQSIESVVTTGRGPTALAFPPFPSASEIDESSAKTAYFAYLADFTDSYLGVLDLDMRHTATYLTFVANVGAPSPPRESK